MPPSVFLSYSRANAPFAQRLKLDLERAGVPAWLDAADIPFGNAWRPEIEKGVEDASHVLVLASPESARSAEVGKEFAFARARDKPLCVLLTAGAEADCPAEWQALQHLDFRRDYWGRLPALLRWLGAPRQTLALPVDLLGRPAGTSRPATYTFRSAATVLTGGQECAAAGRTFAAVPARSSAYLSVWLVGEADAPFGLPDRMQVLLKFSGQAQRGESLPEVLEFLLADGQPPSLIYVQGPRDRDGNYDLPLDRPHVWEESVRATVQAVQEWGKGKELSYFLEGPLPLVFAVAAQLREMGPYRLYQLNRAATAGKGRYRLVYERLPS